MFRCIAQHSSSQIGTFTNFSRNLKSFLKSAAAAQQETRVNIRKRQDIEPLCDCNQPNVLQKCNASPRCQYRVDAVPVYIKTYGCQMNVNDTNIVTSILQEFGYEIIENEKEAKIYLLMTCAIRESAESKIWRKLLELKRMKDDPNIPLERVGLLGCMAERLKDKVIERDKLVDIVAGPDAYRDLARMFSVSNLNHEKAVNCLLSFDETYSDVTPVTKANEVSSFISITRGCDNLCSYCIVPFTRGRERSRPLLSIVDESKHLFSKGIRQVTLLGQNVNSYRDLSTDPSQLDRNDLDNKINELESPAIGFKTVYNPRKKGLTFDLLLEEVAKVSPELRIRFTSPHPKDFTDDVIEVMRRYPNISKCVHLPAQSGSNSTLKKMRRGYTSEAYLNLVDRMRSAIPDIAITSDFICGFCGETEEDHQATLDLIRKVGYNFIYVFAYSMRDKTHASHNYTDNIPHDVKCQRVVDVTELFLKQASEINRQLVGSEQLVLVESVSRKSKSDMQGRADNNVKTIMPQTTLEDLISNTRRAMRPGDYVLCRIESSTSHTLKATPLFITNMQKFHSDNRELTSNCNNENFVRLKS